MGIYFRTGLVGDSPGNLDNLNGSRLGSNDIGITSESGEVYFHYLDENSGLPLSSPNIIPPSANAGNKRWVLCDFVTKDLVHYGEIEYSYTGVQTLIGSGEINADVPVTEFQATGADILSIADGSQSQVKYVCMVSGEAGGHFGILSGENFAGDNLLFAHNGDSAALLFTSGKWYYLKSTQYAKDSAFIRTIEGGEVRTIEGGGTRTISEG